MNLQQKIFAAGLALTPEELQAIAMAEAQLREKARAGDGLCVSADDPGKDPAGLCVDDGN
jgi:hypothetical protein